MPNLDKEVIKILEKNKVKIPVTGSVISDLKVLIADREKKAKKELLEKLMASREVYSQVTNGHIHIKNIDYEYWKLTGKSLIGREAKLQESEGEK